MAAAEGECCPRVQCVPVAYPAGVDCSDVPVPKCGADMGLRRVEPSAKGKGGQGGNPCPSYVCGEVLFMFFKISLLRFFMLFNLYFL